MRQYSRLIFRSLFRARVYTINNSLVGYVADISESGIRMRSDVSFEPASEHCFRIKIRKNENQNLNFDVKFKCVWSRLNPVTGHIETGFSLVQPNEQYQKYVAKLVGPRPTDAVTQATP